MATWVWREHTMLSIKKMPISSTLAFQTHEMCIRSMVA